MVFVTFPEGTYPSAVAGLPVQYLNVDHNARPYLWAKPSDLNAIRADANVTSAELRLASDLEEQGDAQGASAVYLITAQPHGDAPSRTPEQIAAQLRPQLRRLGARVSVVQDAPPSDEIGSVPVAGQLHIRFRGGRQAQLRRMLQALPQAAAIRWGEPFTFFNCPPCGMG